MTSTDMACACSRRTRRYDAMSVVLRHIRSGYRDDQADTLHESLGPSLTRNRGGSLGNAQGPTPGRAAITSRRGIIKERGTDKLHGNLTHPFPTMRIAQNAIIRKQTYQVKRGYLQYVTHC